MFKLEGLRRLANLAIDLDRQVVHLLLPLVFNFVFLKVNEELELVVDLTDALVTQRTNKAEKISHFSLFLSLHWVSQQCETIGVLHEAISKRSAINFTIPAAPPS